MPILKQEPDCFPDNLLEVESPGAQWWALYTRSRQEKTLARQLREKEIGFYSPLVSRRHKSPAGRIRESFLPLFSNYVFVCGSEMDRYTAVSTGCVSRVLEVQDVDRLTFDLRQIHRLIHTGAPLSPEALIAPGDRVRVKKGRFSGFEGTVLRRNRETILIVEVTFMNQGASVALDDCDFELIEKYAG